MSETIVRVDDTLSADELRRWINSADELRLCYSVEKFNTTGQAYREQCPNSPYAKIFKAEEPAVFWIFRLELTP